MEKKHMPLSVKVIFAVHTVLLALLVLFILNQVAGLIDHRTLGKTWREVTSLPINETDIIFYSGIFVMILTIYGFLHARPYARNITITFWGLLVLHNGITLLHPFTVQNMIGWVKLLAFFRLAFLCVLIFLFYLALRTDVYEYCRPSDRDP